MRWTIPQIQSWHDQRPRVLGANFIPSTAINQLEMWQADTFDPATIQRELGWAQGLGMNLMRVSLHDLLWEQDQDGFCQRIDQYLRIAANLGIRTMFVLFDDCGRSDFSLGRQPDPIPFVHNSGWIKSPGLEIVRDPTQWPRLEHYVTGLLSRFKDDERIAVWDVYNEPGNGFINNAPIGSAPPVAPSLPLLQAAFTWARSVAGLSQPLTTGVWNFSPAFQGLNEWTLANSDLITFHSYNPPPVLIDLIQTLKVHHRPIVCTEYMARTEGSTFAACLPVLRENNVGAIHWGLVAGKTQTIYPWFWSPEKGQPSLVFHDIFNRDGTFLHPAEESLFRRLAASNESYEL